MRDENVGEAAAQSANLPLDASPIEISELASAADIDALLDLGEKAFFRYPTGRQHDAAYALTSQSGPASYGFWRDDQIGGLVWEQMANGSAELAVTCSTCHARMEAGVLLSGAANAELDLGRLAIDAGEAQDDRVRALAAWGPGRLDVSSADGVEPVKIPDLRPVRDLWNLQADATVRQGNLIALAIRIETLIVTSSDQAVRPPREVALGLAVFLWSLEATLPHNVPSDAVEQQGARLFTQACAHCHGAPGFAGQAVRLEAIGTDPALGLSPDRGTGLYRVPSLRGLLTRGPLLHDGSLRDLRALLDPSRLAESYTGGRLGPGPVLGHEAGLDRVSNDRAALVAYLQTL